jgi:NitT/TauT family transport system substrate-binding protein
MIFAPLFVAIERGYFAQEGIDAQLTPVQGGSDSVVQLAAGNFDVAASGAGAGLLNAVYRGVKFKIVAPMHSERPPLTSPLVVGAGKKDALITSIADLKGKKVAINAPGGAAEYWLSEALKKGGLSMNDVQVTSVGFADVPAALKTGSISAAILGEPFTTEGKDNGTVTVLADDFINGFTATYIYMGDSMLKERPQVASGFIKAYLRACRDLQGDYLKTDPDIARIIEKYTHVPADVAARAAAPQYSTNGMVPVGDIEKLQEYFLQRGELDYTQPIDITTFVDDSLAKAVAAELK